MYMARISVSTLVAAALLTASAAQAEEQALPSPKAWLETKVREGHQLAIRKVKTGSKAEEKWRSEAKKLIDDMLDWDELTRKALGRNWKDRSEAERKEFGALLRQMIESSYQSKLRITARDKASKPKDVKIDWEEETLKKKKARLVAAVTADKKEVLLQFDLLWRDGRWRVYDISIDTVSTVRVYRRQFNQVIAEKGWPALMGRLKQKIKDIKEGRAELTQAG